MAVNLEPDDLLPYEACDTGSRSSSVLDPRAGNCEVSGLEITPPDLFFGALIIGAGNIVPQTATVKNVGAGSITILDIIFSSGSNNFKFVDGFAYPEVLKAGESFDLSVVPIATMISQIVGVIEIVTNEDRLNYTIGLSARVVGTNVYEDILDQAKALISEEAILRVTGDSAEATLRQTVVAQLGNDINAKIVTERTASVNRDSALATSIEQLRADFETPEGGAIDAYARAEITTEKTVRANAISAEASRVDNLLANYSTSNVVQSNISAAVSSSEQATAASIGALAGRVNTTEANYEYLNEQDIETNARIDEEVTAIANKFLSEATRIDNLLSTYTTDGEANTKIAAAISDERLVRTAAETALSQLITSLTSTVGGNTTTITQQAESINGVLGKWGVKVDNNGAVTGIQLNNGTGGSDFTVQADQFKFQTAGGKKTPFSVDGSRVNLGVDLYVGAYKVILDTGAVMLVQGTGFGSANQFIMWFGPTMIATSCTESNAIFYLTTTGAAYFGGTLNAGIITNSRQTTSLAGDASISTGDFGSNGNQRVVNVAYRMGYNTTSFATICPNPAPIPSAVVRLYRGTSAAGVFLYEFTFTGNSTCIPALNEAEPGFRSSSVQSSATYVDNAGGTNVSYFAQIVSRSTAFGIQTQGLGITSVEQ